jgi:hypothetical protein
MSGMGVASVSARTSMYPVPDVPPFGVYQLAIPEWQEYAYETLEHVQAPVRMYIDGLKLPEGSSRRFGINQTYAATFVERRDTRDRDDLEGIDFGSVIERVGNLTASSEVIAVPIADLEWCASRIVAPFDQESGEYKRLLDQQVEIEHILHDAGMEEPPVNRPHHTSLSGFSFQFEAAPLHTRIYRNHRKEIIRMISRRLTYAGIDSVELGGLIVGQNYTSPFASGNWLTNSCVEVVSYGDMPAS